MVRSVHWWRWARAKAIAAKAAPPLERLPKGIPLSPFLKRWLTSVSSEITAFKKFYPVDLPSEPPEEGKDYDIELDSCSSYSDPYVNDFYDVDDHVYSMQVIYPVTEYYEGMHFILAGDFTDTVWIVDYYRGFYQICSSVEEFIVQNLNALET